MRIRAALLAGSYGNFFQPRVWYQMGLAAAVQGTQMILVALIGHTLGCRATDPMGFKANFVTYHTLSPMQSRSTI